MEEKKVYRLGDIIGVIKEEEMEELKSLSKTKAATKIAIKDLMDTLIELEEISIQERSEWWERMHKKYNTPSEADLRKRACFGENLIIKLSYETRELYIGVETRR